MARRALGVKRHIARWREAGLIDSQTAEALLADVGRSGLHRWRMADALAIMAGILVGAAVLAFTAANWDAIPRLVRVIALFSVIAAGYVGGAVLRVRGHEWMAHACWIVSAFSFGASIALVTQMYHLSGSEEDAVLIWAAGTVLAAFVLRSAPLTVMASLLAAGWMMMTVTERIEANIGLIAWPVFALVLFALTVWTESRKSRHIILFSLTVFSCLLVWQLESAISVMLLCTISALLFVLAHYYSDYVDPFFRIGDWLSFHALLAFLSGIWTLQLHWVDSDGFLPASIVALIAIVAALATAGRDDRAVRWLAYSGFAVQIFSIYAVMIATMLGTAGFFLVAGLLLAGLAFAAARFEKRRRNGEEQG